MAEAAIALEEQAVDFSLPEERELLFRLMTLAKCLSIDANSGDLILQRGESKLTLKENGEVRIQARSIVQIAQEDITLSGAYIDLN